METLPISVESFKVGFIGAGKMVEIYSNLNRRQVFESFGVNVFSSSEEVVKETNVVIFSVKPQEWSGQDWFVRVMPNTPAAVGEAASVMSLGTAATEEDGAVVAKFFGSVGKMFKADEKMIDVVTGLSGSGPAYIFLAIQALADGGVAAGLPPRTRTRFSFTDGQSTDPLVLGGATMVSKMGKQPGVLKDDVTSPSGTTIA
ncbi:hypothetical protein Bca52824_047591 [Brassica carinata]|uniref:Pyrroline-5-carboxylate reductase dimerisation domain-containing protein n=1 Tax=Brassica carinata TaxID=52824 RepID=A0A8X7URE8_BRACI|nr:hypothetical protein Bca52824_047591 [Brassica carinata]